MEAIPLTHPPEASLWCIHQITPIHKSGERSLVKNYRPISLLCIISKVFAEIIVKNSITYCSPVWRQQFIKKLLIQKRATKFILSNHSSDYKTHLISHQILPLMMQLELNNIFHNLFNPLPDELFFVEVTFSLYMN